MWINKKNMVGRSYRARKQHFFFHIHWREKKKSRTKDYWLQQMALNSSVIQHWKIKNKTFFSFVGVRESGKICGATVYGFYGARPCERKFSNELQVECFPLLNRLQLPPAHVLSLQSPRSSPLPTTTITHISVIQFIVPFVRLRESDGGRGSEGSEQLLTFCFIALPLNRPTAMQL